MVVILDKELKEKIKKEMDLDLLYEQERDWKYELENEERSERQAKEDGFTCQDGGNKFEDVNKL
jgi:hypothetical protein